MEKTITLTFGCMSENHIGMEKIGKGLSENGFNLNDLKNIASNFKKIDKNINLHIHSLKDLIKNYVSSDLLNYIDDAHILVIKNGVECILDSNLLFNELINLDWDKKAFMKGRVVNKKARYNLCFSNFSQNPDYENKKGRTYDMSKLTHLNNLNESIKKLFTNKALDLQCEGNFYYDLEKTYIKYHGDAERRRVIGIRLGDSLPLYFQWFYKSKKFGDVLKINLDGGDIYVMSEKAVGTDWMKKNSYTLRHSAVKNLSLIEKT